MNESTPEQIEQALAVQFACELGDNITLRQWLMELLAKLWNEGEGFNGKRPFGNSGWDWTPAAALVNAGLIQGTVTEDGYAEEFDERAMQKLVSDAIAYMADQ